MQKSVAVYALSTPNVGEKNILADFGLGVHYSGDKIHVISSDVYIKEDADVHVIFGSWKPRTDQHHLVKNMVVDYCKENNKPFICFETPLIGRKKVEQVMKDEYFRVGINGFLADTGNFNNINCPRDRWDKIKENLDIELRPWRQDGDRITIALQLPGDASLRGANISKWAYDTARKVKNILSEFGIEKRIVIRTPQLPRQFENIEKLQDLGCEIEIGTKENLNDSFRNCWAAITYSSGYAIDAIINGVPVIACDPGSFAYEVSSNDVNFIMDPKIMTNDERQQWLQDLSYAQWHKRELGKAWRHLRDRI